MVLPLLIVVLAGLVGLPLAAQHARASEPPGFEALSAPQRILDTRPGAVTADGGSAGGGLVGARSILTLPVAGRVGLPTSVGAVVLNVTVTEPVGVGFVTVFPCGEAVPTASNVNYRAGQTVPNAVISGLANNGSVCLFTLAATHLVVDVSGWFPEDSYVPLPAPRRLADTRAGQSTIDGAFAGIGLRAAGSVLELDVAGRATIDASAASVALNVTATQTAGPGFVVVYPCGVPRPTASNVNYLGGDTVPNLVVSKIGVGGRVCLYTLAAAHLVVDVAGSFAASTYSPLSAPQRLVDTRSSPDGTIDGRFWGVGVQPASATLQFQVAGRGEVPADASGVVLNVTAVSPAAPGFLTVHPRGSSLPNASNVNFAPRDVVANAVVARVGVAGEVCLFTLATTDIVVDVAGWFRGPPPDASGEPCPSVLPGGAGAAGELVRYAAEHRAVGVDRIAVLPCSIVGYPGAENPPPAAEVAAWANANVTPWFDAASRGRYHPVFEAHPAGIYVISGPDVHPDYCGPFKLNAFDRRLCDTGQSVAEYCTRAESPPTGAPFTNLVMYTSGGGFASEGTTGLFDPTDGWTVLDRSPEQSRRGVILRAATFDTVTWVHEVGHTIHWPHSYITNPEQDRFDEEYDNPLDVMSQDLGDGAQNTLAFNRLAAGWIDDDQVAIHRSGQANYTLDSPVGDGIQLVALPSPTHPWRLMTIEARPTTGYDSGLTKAGVAIHAIDQTGGGTPCDGLCFLEDRYGKVSASRRQAQAMGVSMTYGHVLAVGETTSIGGVTVSVLASEGNGYRIEVTGSYTAPSEL